ncbi:MAG: thermonuclease family protein [Candidatus Peribacteraceae bacterium]|nr:thermonuclease family protein [Candidatus Peribacteraceae bacterium]
MNLELIQKGYATIYEDIEKSSEFYEKFEQAETGSRELGLGIWAAE